MESRAYMAGTSRGLSPLQSNERQTILHSHAMVAHVQELCLLQLPCSTAGRNLHKSSSSWRYGLMKSDER